MVDEKALAEKNLCLRIFSLRSSLKAKQDCVDNVPGNKDMSADRSEDFDAFRAQLQKRDETLCEEHE